MNPPGLNQASCEMMKGGVRLDTLTPGLQDDLMVSWELGMSGPTPPRRAAPVTRLLQSQTPTPGLENQSRSDSRGGLGTITVH